MSRWWIAMIYEVDRKKLFLTSQMGNMYKPDFRFILKYFDSLQSTSPQFKFACPLVIQINEQLTEYYEPCHCYQ